MTPTAYRSAAVPAGESCAVVRYVDIGDVLFGDRVHVCDGRLHALVHWEVVIWVCPGYAVLMSGEASVVHV